MLSIKISFKDEVRRVQIQEEIDHNAGFEQLTETVRNIFPELKNRIISLIWKDDENDLITVSSDLELTESIRVMGPNSTLRYTVKVEEGKEVKPVAKAEPYIVEPAKSVTPSVSHIGVRCDECNINPVVGIRYKCTVREDFDLCESCEAKKIQPYPMVKIFDPQHAPATLVYAFKDQEVKTETTVPPQEPNCGGGWRNSGFAKSLGFGHPPGHGFGYGGRGGGGRGGPWHHGGPHGAPCDAPPHHPHGPPHGHPHGPHGGPHAAGPHGPGPFWGGRGGHCPRGPPGFGPHGSFGTGCPVFEPASADKPPTLPPKIEKKMEKWEKKAERIADKCERKAEKHALRCEKQIEKIHGHIERKFGGGVRGYDTHYYAVESSAPAEPSAFIQGMDGLCGPGTYTSLQMTNAELQALLSGENSNINNAPSAQSEEVVDPDLQQAIRASYVDMIDPNEESDVEDIHFDENLEKCIEASLRDASHVTTSATATNTSLASSLSMSALPQKYEMRFVRDITFPNGTLVQPGAVFQKVWRVRNDGLYTWPEQTTLAFAGGDILSDVTAVEPVPEIEVGQETDIAMTLTAPEHTGRFVTFFRMQSKDEVKFGQRLYANILVSDEESDWQLIRGPAAVPEELEEVEETAVATVVRGGLNGVDVKPDDSASVVDTTATNSDDVEKVTAVPVEEDEKRDSEHSVALSDYGATEADGLDFVDNDAINDSLEDSMTLPRIYVTPVVNDESAAVEKEQEQEEEVVQTTTTAADGVATTVITTTTRTDTESGEAVDTTTASEESEFAGDIALIDSAVASAAAAATLSASSAPITVPVVSVTAPIAATTYQSSLAVLWARELALLNDMGFSDLNVLVPLLQTHVGTPATLGSSEAVQVEGMQRVVATLLNSFGMLH